MRTMRLILAIISILLVASFSYGAAVYDTGSPNFLNWWSNAYYDYRDMGSWSPSPLGTEGVSGAYFQVTAGIQTGGYLTDFNKVSSITATHSPSERTYPLIPASCRDWQLLNHWPWSIFLRPEGWMFTGTWSFTLVYTGYDKKQHMQICDGNVDNLGTKYPVEAAPIEAIPSAVSHIQIVGPSTEGFLVSWTGIGDNGGNVDYRIEIFTPDDVCVEVVYRMRWREDPNCPSGQVCTCPAGAVCVGKYDPALNRVSFNVPGEYSGRLVRLSQHIIAPYKAWPRAMKQIRLPE